MSIPTNAVLSNHFIYYAFQASNYKPHSHPMPQWAWNTGPCWLSCVRMMHCSYTIHHVSTIHCRHKPETQWTTSKATVTDYDNRNAFVLLAVKKSSRIWTHNQCTIDLWEAGMLLPPVAGHATTANASYSHVSTSRWYAFIPLLHNSN